MEHSSQQLQWIFENVPDFAVFTLDTQRRVTSWNLGAERLLGWSEAEILGKSADVFFTPEDRVVGVPLYESLLSTQEGRVEEERWHSCKDGSQFWGGGLLTPVFGGDGEVQGFVKLFHDLTKLRQVQESARMERERFVAEIKALKERLSLSVEETHHRVRNNLQVLSALVEIEESHQRGKAQFRRIKQHTQTLAIIHDLLTVQAKEDPAHPFSVSAQTVLGKLIPLLDQSGGERRVRAKVEAILLPVQKSAAVAFLVNECVSNALKHAHGEVEVTLRRGDARAQEPERRRARLEVCDDGPGFPLDFDPQRKDHLGLQLIDRAARWDLRGDIAFQNREEGGARVVVTFPLATEEQAQK